MPLFEIPVGPPGSIPALVTGEELAGMSQETQSLAKRVDPYGRTIPGRYGVSTDVDIRPGFKYTVPKYKEIRVGVPQKISRFVSTMQRLTPSGMIQAQLNPMQQRAKEIAEERTRDVRERLRKEAEEQIKQATLTTREIVKEAPPGFFPKIQYYTSKPFEAIDPALERAGVPEEIRTFQLYGQPLGLGTSPLSLEPEVLGEIRQSLFRKLPQTIQPKIPTTPAKPTIKTSTISTIKDKGVGIFKRLSKPTPLGVELSTGQVADISSYFVPVVGQTRAGIFLSSFTERGAKGVRGVIKEKGVKAVPGAVWQYTKENPFEVGSAVLIGGVTVFKGVKALGGIKRTSVTLGATKATEITPTTFETHKNLTLLP